MTKHFAWTPALGVRGIVTRRAGIRNPSQHLTHALQTEMSITSSLSLSGSV